MTILVGYVQGEGGLGGLQLGAMAAESLHTDLVVATVVPKPWTTPSMAKVDAEFASWTDEVAATAEAEVAEYMTIYPPELSWRFTRLDHRTVASALIEHARALDADAIAISSTGDGQLGQIVLGSTADTLMHRSPVPVGISPRGYRSPKDGLLTRVTAAISGSGPESRSVIARARGLCDRMDGPLRVVSFAVRGGAMYPPLVGLSTEDDVLSQWQAQSAESHRMLLDDGVIAPGTDCVVAAGRGYREAFDSIEWIGGEVLFLGSARDGVLAQVFLGSRASKLIRHSPVPVLVLPR
ncbi:MAG: universal stress protein UspA [Gordonia sp.]|jgi:nucleotide-binding universal stress UspA family protein|uniref:universal stress protein n=1 Tax=Gordonia sp. (in: high G+C Gram-positive bacteria) TaxID=84139 RepID=UPI000C4ECF4C|nr:universal stress protein [Gordonia sp. (in: high G+C Gram-positive bacteria)]MAU82245.1 universal stress protein UspA [Gordonia sp. (in: high G+C Gram-positive bacteria)]